MNYRVDVKKCLRNSDFNAISLGLNQELSSESNTVESKVKRLRQVFNWYASGKHFNQASELIKQLHPVVPDLRFALLECDLLIRSKSGDEAAEKVLMDQLNEDRDKMVWYPWTSERFGLHSLREQNFEEALKVLNNALNKASDAKDQENITLFKQLITIVEKVRDDEKKKQEDEEKKQADEKQEKEKPQQQQKTKKKKGKKEIVIQEKCKGEKEEGEKNLVVGEKKDDIPDEMAKMDQEKEIEKKGNSKKKGANIWQRIKAGKKKEEEKKEIENLERNTDVKKDNQPRKASGDIEEEEKKENENLEEEKSKCPIPFESDIPFKFFGEQLPDEECLVGFVQTNATRIRKAAIKARNHQIDDCQYLVDLCAQHDSLVAVEHAFTHSDGNKYLLTGVVTSIQRYFESKFQVLKPTSIQNWWRDIEDIFWIISRDIVRGLMFLFKNNLSCGNVSFNVFVTDGGRGRILPSLEPTSRKEMMRDVAGLIQVMKTIIEFPFGKHGEDLSSFLPADLMSFFDFMENVDSRWNDIPVLYLVDHPYLWSTAEKIEFTFKVRKLIKLTDMPSKIGKKLVTLGFFQDWFNKLTTLSGVYYEVYQYKQKRNSPYRDNIDIVRYFGAALTHVNDRDYKEVRKFKRISDQDIEKDLSCLFPGYYIYMFECLCFCRQTKVISNENLMEVSSVYHQPT